MRSTSLEGLVACLLMMTMGLAGGCGDDSEAGDNAGDPYGPCLGAPCAHAEATCYEDPFEADWTVCTVPCDASGDCPDAQSGTATPYCDQNMISGCALACVNVDECPSGMICDYNFCEWAP